MKHSVSQIRRLADRTPGDYILFGITLAELAFLLRLAPAFTLADWIYLAQHLLVLGIALVRRPPSLIDRSVPAGLAVIVAYAYPYAQMLCLRWTAGEPAWPAAGFALVTLAAGLSLVSLATLGGSFGVRPALRELVTEGPYRAARHPMYLAYVLADIGVNLQEWNAAGIPLVIAGWASLLYRIHAEERLLARDPAWPAYAAQVRWRLLPGIW